VWNGIFVFVSETYIVIATVSLIGVQDLRFGNRYSTTENFCSFVSVGLLIYTLVFPVIIGALYLVKFKSSTIVHFNKDLLIKYGDQYVNKLEKVAYSQR